jgi:hypothetical protein
MLSFLVEDPNVNLVEVSLYRSKQSFGYEVGWSKPNVKLTEALEDTYGSGFKQNLMEYVHRDMVYVYDRYDDRQKVYRKIPQNENDHNPVYGVGYKEETLPVHRFPCTSEVTTRQQIRRVQYRVNNRMFIHDDEDEDKNHYYTIRYQHSTNVDLKKMEQDFERALALFKRYA